MQPAVFLDRDNTLIENDGDLGDPNQVKLIQGAAAAIGSLRGLGYKIVVVSNQGGVARGKYGESDVDAVHERINELVRQFASGAFVDRFYYCPFHPLGSVARYTREHPWRKPQPGMLLQAAKDMDLDLEQSWTIGDQLRDVQAGAAAGTRTVLLDPTGRAQRPSDDDESRAESDFVAGTLVEAVRIVAQQRKPETMEDIRADAPGSAEWNTAAAAAIQRQRTEAASKRTADAAAALSGSSRSAPEAEPPKPFRPLTLPMDHDEEQHYDEEIFERGRTSVATPAAKTPEPADTVDMVEEVISTVTRQTPEAAPATLPQEEPAPVEPPAEPVAKIEPAPAPAPHATAAPVEPVPPQPPPPRSLVQTQPVVVEAEEPVAVAPPAVSTPPVAETESAPPPSRRRGARPERGNASGEALLRQILQELRNQRNAVKEWSWLGYVAVVLQLMALLCLFAGMTMGDEITIFFKWLGTGVLVQLAVIAILLFDRQ